LQLQLKKQQMVSGRDRDPGYNKKKVTKPLEQTPATDKTRTYRSIFTGRKKT
jgi:hypothetical protein